MPSSRPPLNRWQSMPVYFEDKDDHVESTLSSLASLNLADSASNSKPSDSASRSRSSLSSFSQRPQAMSTRSPADSPAAGSPYHSPHGDHALSYPTPPYSSSSATAAAALHHMHPHQHHSRAYSYQHATASYFPPHASYSSMMSSSRSNSSRSSSANTSPSASIVPGSPHHHHHHYPHTSSPSASASTSSAAAAAAYLASDRDMPPLVKTCSSGILRNKSGKSSIGVKMSVESTGSHYVLVAPLGPGYSADGITIAARKENVLMIIADRWDEEDSHHEWQVQFGRDGDMSSIHASFENGILRITVKRLHMPP